MVGANSTSDESLDVAYNAPASPDEGHEGVILTITNGDGKDTGLTLNAQEVSSAIAVLAAFRVAMRDKTLLDTSAQAQTPESASLPYGTAPPSARHPALAWSCQFAIASAFARRGLLTDGHPADDKVAPPQS